MTQDSVLESLTDSLYALQQVNVSDLKATQLEVLKSFLQNKLDSINSLEQINETVTI